REGWTSRSGALLRRFNHRGCRTGPAKDKISVSEQAPERFPPVHAACDRPRLPAFDTAGRQDELDAGLFAERIEGNAKNPGWQVEVATLFPCGNFLREGCVQGHQYYQHGG